MAGVVLVPGVIAAVPGGESSCTVRVRNTGSVVDSYTITVLGDAAAWSTPMPAVLSLFPGAEGEATITFRPPRSPELAAGPVDFAVRVVATEDPDGSVVEEGVVTIDAYQDFVARITPRTSETKRKARHTITVDNRGNAPLNVDLAASDPDEQLAFDLRPTSLTVAPGQTGSAVVNAIARHGFARGTDQHRPFQATVTPQPAGMQPPTLLDATLVQRAGLPRFVPALIAAAIVIALAAVLVPSLMKKDDGGTITLTGSEPTTTVTVPGAGGDEEGAEAEATAEEAGAPATTNPPNRQGTSSGGAAAAGGATAAAGGGSASATTAASTATTEAPSVTTPDAKPVTSTTAPPQTTTTAPPPYAKFLGTWKNVTTTNFEPQIIIRNDASYLWVHGYGSCSPSYCDWGEVKTPLADGNDNQINVRYDQSGIGSILQRIVYQPNGQLAVHSDQYHTDGSFWYSKDEVYNKA